MFKKLQFLGVIATLLAVTTALDKCTTPPDTGHYVGIGFWKSDDCSGDPMGVNYHNLDFGDTKCYCWTGTDPNGKVHVNSAYKYKCDTAAKSFTLT